MHSLGTKFYAVVFNQSFGYKYTYMYMSIQICVYTHTQIRHNCVYCMLGIISTESAINNVHVCVFYLLVYVSF